MKSDSQRIVSSEDRQILRLSPHDLKFIPQFGIQMHIHTILLCCAAIRPAFVDYLIQKHY